MINDCLQLHIVGFGFKRIVVCYKNNMNSTSKYGFDQGDGLCMSVKPMLGALNL